MRQRSDRCDGIEVLVAVAESYCNPVCHKAAVRRIGIRSPRTLITRLSLPAGIPSTSPTNTTVSPTSIDHLWSARAVMKLM
jgi:hypothetical protein